ncbi:hypothetical protein CICLE_v10019355mg [Citrus x clementina]|uniref:Protein kinase domain-containing protein n=1 Tax=Citrus clementina TaxID=85681 RepID=V4TQY7_CITCL|nr:hypothetical protein CICLE_v10019355mg [Citrus x clementina]
MSNQLIIIFCTLITVVNVPAAYGRHDEQYAACSHRYSCGSSLQDIGYPFWGNNRPRIMTISRGDLWDTLCPGIFNEASFNNSPFYYSQNSVGFVTLFFNCGDEIFPDRALNTVSCNVGGRKRVVFYTNITNIDGASEGVQFPNISKTCNSSIKVPVLLTAVNYIKAGELGKALKQGFDVGYHSHPCSECKSSGGICDLITRILRNLYAFAMTDPRQTPVLVRICLSYSFWFVFGVASAGIGVLTVTCIIIRCYGFNISSIISNSIFRKLSKDDQDLESVINNYGPLAPKRYSFSYIKKMTNSFKHKLGQGGYGSVFKGKLPDGRLVAVKLLNTSKENVQEFVNEVASISRTSHVNVVTLLGFCLEGSKRALVYEYMPNGSLEKFIHNGDTSKAHQHLGWEKFYHIAIETARGLEYLHRGCNTRILHLDIKPHNILLDEEFCPKISDFGLAKLCPPKESNVSLFEARGTIGYVAPEVLSRSFGEVSHKSDVYSYGMMILEMVGCKNNPDAGVDETSDIYFPHWIYKHVEQGKVFKLPSVMSSNENEIEIAKKMVIVGLWCIQTHPSYRPAMNKVIDMLQGSIEALQIPPKPFLSSPPRLSSMGSSFTSMS